LQLAEQVQAAGDVQARWREMLAAEAKLIQLQSPGPRMHSGL